MTAVLRNGRLVTPDGVQEGDISYRDGVIEGIGTGLAGRTVADVEGAWVLPGAVDPHLHISLGGHSITEPLLHDLHQAARAALRGGVTTIGVYAQRTPATTVAESIGTEIGRERDGVAADYFINALLMPGDDIEGTVARSSQVGVISFKTMVAYASRGLMLDDASICLLMERAAAVGGVTLVHAENGGAIDYLDAVERNRGVTNASYLRSQPVDLEPEGMNRTAMFAALTGCRLHFVHCTSAPGAAMLGTLKSSGASVTAETQIHYLLLTNDEVLQRGPLGKVGPPLRDADHLPQLWEALADGRIDHLSSDHSPKSLEVKLAAANILDATFGGIAGTGVMLPLAFSEGFKKGRLTIERVAEVTSTRAAQIYGIYPQKGVLAEGSDADLVVIPEGQPEVRLTHDNLATEAGYSLYESIVTSGMPSLVIRGGSVVISDGQLVGPENGRYLARSRQA
ncbi:MAG: amidohydrolase family protein [bacterium]|nr:amidohydrolase family protein [bacterium]MDE0601078.1 amidohydrolase family protein [bacterium]